MRRLHGHSHKQSWLCTWIRAPSLTDNPLTRSRHHSISTGWENTLATRVHSAQHLTKHAPSLYVQFLKKYLPLFITRFTPNKTWNEDAVLTEDSSSAFNKCKGGRAPCRKPLIITKLKITKIDTAPAISLRICAKPCREMAHFSWTQRQCAVHMKPVLNWVNICSQTQLGVFSEYSWLLTGRTFASRILFGVFVKLYSGSKKLH